MKEFSLYEQAGIVLPGAGLLLGLLVLEPAIQPVFLGSGLTVGGLGLFVIISFALGHLVAAIGNFLDAVFWIPFGGLPSQWPRIPSRKLLGPKLRGKFLAKLKSRLDIHFKSTEAASSAEWRDAFHLVYRDVLASGSASRVEQFNGTYGLNRGLAAGALLLVPLVIQKSPESWQWWVGALIAMAVIYAYRMYRFGVHFAREVFIRFTLLPDPPARG